MIDKKFADRNNITTTPVGAKTLIVRGLYTIDAMEGMYTADIIIADFSEGYEVKALAFHPSPSNSHWTLFVLVLEHR